MASIVLLLRPCSHFAASNGTHTVRNLDGSKTHDKPWSFKTAKFARQPQATSRSLCISTAPHPQLPPCFLCDWRCRRTTPWRRLWKIRPGDWLWACRHSDQTSSSQKKRLINLMMRKKCWIFCHIPFIFNFGKCVCCFVFTLPTFFPKLFGKRCSRLLQVEKKVHGKARRKLRSQKLLCDVILSTEKAQHSAHQARSVSLKKALTKRGQVEKLKALEINCKKKKKKKTCVAFFSQCWMFLFLCCLSKNNWKRWSWRQAAQRWRRISKPRWGFIWSYDFYPYTVVVGCFWLMWVWFFGEKSLHINPEIAWVPEFAATISTAKWPQINMAAEQAPGTHLCSEQVPGIACTRIVPATIGLGDWAWVAWWKKSNETENDRFCREVVHKSNMDQYGNMTGDESIVGEVHVEVEASSIVTKRVVSFFVAPAAVTVWLRHLPSDESLSALLDEIYGGPESKARKKKSFTVFHSERWQTMMPLKPYDWFSRRCSSKWNETIKKFKNSNSAETGAAPRWSLAAWLDQWHVGVVNLFILATKIFPNAKSSRWINMDVYVGIVYCQNSICLCLCLSFAPGSNCSSCKPRDTCVTWRFNRHGTALAMPVIVL